MNFNLIHRGKLRPLAFLCELNKGQKEKEKKMDYKRNAKYFKSLSLPPKGWMAFIVIIGILFAVKPVFGILGLIVFCAVIWGIYGGKPSDAEIDAQLDALMNGLEQQALRKLGLDEEEVKIAPPLFLKSYSFGGSVLKDKANQKLCDKQGKDGYWRSPECVLTAWFFTEEQIYHYVKYASLVSDSKRETTDEVFYKDVVSVKTDTSERPLIDPKTGKESLTEKYTETQFILRNTGGEVIADACDTSESADEAVRAMRSLLKQKKMA